MLRDMIIECDECGKTSTIKFDQENAKEDDYDIKCPCCNANINLLQNEMFYDINEIDFSEELDFKEPLTPEQIKMLEELDKRPIVFDEDCPELTDEQLRKAYRASDRKKQSVTVQLSAKSMEKVKSLGANSTSVLSQLLEKVLNNENLLKQCM